MEIYVILVTVQNEFKGMWVELKEYLKLLGYKTALILFTILQVIYLILKFTLAQDYSWHIILMPTYGALIGFIITMITIFVLEKLNKH